MLQCVLYKQQNEKNIVLYSAAEKRPVAFESKTQLDFKIKSICSKYILWRNPYVNQTQKLWHVEVWYTLPCRGGVFPPWGPSSSSLRSKGLRRVWRKLASLSPYSIVLSTSVYKMSLFYWSETDTVVLTSTSPHDSQVFKKYKSRVTKLIFFFQDIWQPAQIWKISNN